MATPQAKVHSPLEVERVYRRNFGYFLADNILFNLALGFTSATTIIPDFVRQLTDSEILIGASGSISIVGLTLPQLFVARYIVRSKRKKWWFVGPNIPVRLMFLGFAIFLLLRGGQQPELTLGLFFVCYIAASIGDGLVNVPYAELSATGLDHRWRARVHGLTDSISSVLLLLVAPLIGLILGVNGPLFPTNYGILFGVAGVLFALSIVPGMFIRELPGGRAIEKLSTFREFVYGLGRALRLDVPFRAMLAIRVLTSIYMMVTPFYIGYATVQLGLASGVAVPMSLFMTTAGAAIGALVYTWLGARNNLLYIRLGLVAATLLPVLALLAPVLGTPLMVGAFFVAGLASSSNLLSSYFNWLVSYAEADQRPLYVGLVNTAAAGVLLIAPFLGGSIVQQLGFRPLFVLSIITTLAALVVAMRALPSELNYNSV